MKNVPRFRSIFLTDISHELALKRKSLRRRGVLTWETIQPDEFEWLTVKITPYVGNHCIFQFVEDNRVCIFVRSKKRQDRGKVLLRIEDLKIVSDSESVFAAIDTTISRSIDLHSGSAGSALAGIREAWEGLAVRVV